MTVLAVAAVVVARMLAMSVVVVVEIEMIETQGHRWNFCSATVGAIIIIFLIPPPHLLLKS